MASFYVPQFTEKVQNSSELIDVLDVLGCKVLCERLRQIVLAQGVNGSLVFAEPVKLFNDKISSISLEDDILVMNCNDKVVAADSLFFPFLYHLLMMVEHKFIPNRRLRFIKVPEDTKFNPMNETAQMVGAIRSDMAMCTLFNSSDISNVEFVKHLIDYLPALLAAANELDIINLEVTQQEKRTPVQIPTKKFSS